jgi:hypothetical protein
MMEKPTTKELVDAVHTIRYSMDITSIGNAQILLHGTDVDPFAQNENGDFLSCKACVERANHEC